MAQSNPQYDASRIMQLERKLPRNNKRKPTRSKRK